MKLFNILILVFIFSSCIHEDNVEQDIVKVGDTIPTFTVYDNMGNIFSSNDCIGKISVIAFVHTSCSDCRNALPELQQAYNLTKDDVKWIVISRNECENDMKEYWQSNDLTLPYSSQDDSCIYNLFAYYNIPRIFIIDRNGIIRYSFDDTNIPKTKNLLEYINRLK